jgi:parallel beta-helix repeat protein
MNLRMPGPYTQFAMTAMLLILTTGMSWGQTDIILAETWVPSSHEVIDCKGGAIRPAVPATESDGAAIPSSPDTLIFLNNISGTKIRNCVLQDATFGIYVVGGGNHSFSGNTINATAAAIAITASNYNSISNNALSGTTSSILVNNGSIGNLVLGNDLTFIPGPDQPRFPGRPSLAGFQYQLGTGSENVGGVINIIVNGELTQVPATTDNFTKNTLVLENNVHTGATSSGIGFLVRSQGSKAIRNTVSGGFVGIAAAGYPDGEPGPFIIPGSCSLDSGRYCATNSDCNLADFDPIPLGTCVGATILFSESRRVVDSEIVGNTVSNAEEGIIAAWTDGVTVKDNNVFNNIFGIDIVGGYALEEGIFRGNIASGNVYGLAIFNILGEYAELEASYNDFGDVPPFTFLPYTLPTSLPNNWWGIPCNEGGFASSPQWPNTTDPTPFSEPVAKAYRVNENKARKKAKCW